MTPKQAPEPDAVPTPQQKEQEEMPDTRVETHPSTEHGDLPRRKTSASAGLAVQLNHEANDCARKVDARIVTLTIEQAFLTVEIMEDALWKAYALGHREGYEKAIQQDLAHTATVQREKATKG